MKNRSRWEFALLCAFGLAASGAASAYVVGPTVPGKWGPPTMGTGATITFSFMSTGVSCAAESSGCVITQLGDGTVTANTGFLNSPTFSIWRSEVIRAMNAWSAVANLTFIEVADGGEPFDAPGTSGHLRFGGHLFDGPSGTLAHGFYPPTNGQTAAGDMHFDIDDCWEVGFDGTGDGCFDIFQVTAHELGHALGLDHTNVPNSLMNAFYSEAFSGPQADDIAGMQFIYGAAVVPLPAAGWLLLSGLAGLGTFARRRKRAEVAA